jgi:hypothetical protein
MPVPSQGHYVFTVFRLLTDFVCLYNCEFLLSLCKIARSSVILLLPLLTIYHDIKCKFGIIIRFRSTKTIQNEAKTKHEIIIAQTIGMILKDGSRSVGSQS